MVPEPPNIWTRKVGHTGLPGQVRNGGYRKAYQGERVPQNLYPPGTSECATLDTGALQATRLGRGRPGLTPPLPDDHRPRERKAHGGGGHERTGQGPG